MGRNWAKILLQNNGVHANETDNCTSYPSDDRTLWTDDSASLGLRTALGTERTT
jgi:hypothetical protein